MFFLGLRFIFSYLVFSSFVYAASLDEACNVSEGSEVYLSSEADVRRVSGYIPVSSPYYLNGVWSYPEVYTVNLVSEDGFAVLQHGFSLIEVPLEDLRLVLWHDVTAAAFSDGVNIRNSKAIDIFDLFSKFENKQTLLQSIVRYSPLSILCNGQVVMKRPDFGHAIFDFKEIDSKELRLDMYGATARSLEPTPRNILDEWIENYSN